MRKNLTIHLFINKINYSVKYEDSLLSLATEKVRYDHGIYLLNGVIKNSLSVSIFSASVGDVITAFITDIFAWDINFLIHVLVIVFK